MDSKTFRLAVLSIVSILLLVAVIVYAANRDRFGELFGKKAKNDTAENDAVTAESVTETEYGEQIGDDLKAFILDPDFFDGDSRTESVIVTTDNKPPAYPIVDDAVVGASTEESESAGEAASEGTTDAPAEGMPGSTGSSTDSSTEASSGTSENKNETGKESSDGKTGN